MSLKRARSRVAGILALAVVLVTGPDVGASSVRLPDSMASIGDSISRAANIDHAHLGLSNPDHSWSTGTSWTDPVASHYERILAANANIAGRNFNDSASSAKMRDAPAQAAVAVQQGVDYVTVLMGGNDVCATSQHAMTSVGAYESAFRQAMDVLTAGLPRARIYVVSVPDVYQLWNVHKQTLAAALTWQLFRICQSMLALTNTEADRQFVRARNIAYNEVLQRVCADYGQCRHDGGRLFGHQFTAADVSMLDYFHPSATGQATLAEIAWRSGYWPEI